MIIGLLLVCTDNATHMTYQLFFFFNDTATTEIYTLSLHDALPIWNLRLLHRARSYEGYLQRMIDAVSALVVVVDREDRKSTRLNSSHANISYAVFCLKKKKKQIQRQHFYH